MIAWSSALFPTTDFLQFDSSESLSAVEESAGEVCTALSIGQGYKVNWISHEVADSDDKVRYQRLHNWVTKRSSGLALNRQGGNNERLPLTAVQECFSRVLDDRIPGEWWSNMEEVLHGD